MSEPERPTVGWSRDEPWAQVAGTHAAVVFLAGERAYKLKKPAAWAAHRGKGACGSG